MTFIGPAVASGVYTATYNGTDIGLFEGPIRMQQSIIGLPVRASQWGQSVIDYVLQGGGYFGVVTVKEWFAGAKAFIWPFNSEMGVVPEAGQLFSSYCSALVLTALSGTPAASYGPVTRTYHYCATLPGHNLDITAGPVERNVVVALGILPQPVSTSHKARFCTDT